MQNLLKIHENGKSLFKGSLHLKILKTLTFQKTQLTHTEHFFIKKFLAEYLKVLSHKFFDVSHQRKYNQLIDKNIEFR